MELEFHIGRTEKVIREAERRMKRAMRGVYAELSVDIESANNDKKLPRWMKHKRGVRIILDPGTPTSSGIALKPDGNLVTTQGVIGPRQRRDVPITGINYVNVAIKQLMFLRDLYNPQKGEQPKD